LRLFGCRLREQFPCLPCSTDRIRPGGSQPSEIWSKRSGMRCRHPPSWRTVRTRRNQARRQGAGRERGFVPEEAFLEARHVENAQALVPDGLDRGGRCRLPARGRRCGLPDLRAETLNSCRGADCVGARPGERGARTAAFRRNRRNRQSRRSRAFLPLSLRGPGTPDFVDCVAVSAASMVGRERGRLPPHRGLSTQSTQSTKSTKSGFSPLTPSGAGDARFRRLRRGVDCVEARPGEGAASPGERPVIPRSSSAASRGILRRIRCSPRTVRPCLA